MKEINVNVQMISEVASNWSNVDTCSTQEKLVTVQSITGVSPGNKED
jgi:hypothetical protein